MFEVFGVFEDQVFEVIEVFEVFEVIEDHLFLRLTDFEFYFTIETVYMVLMTIIILVSVAFIVMFF